MARQGRSPWSRQSGERQPVPGIRENSREAESVRVPDTSVLGGSGPFAGRPICWNNIQAGREKG